MPLYDVRCTNCGDQRELWRTLAHFNDPMPNCDCGGYMKYQPSAPQIMGDIGEYTSLMDGTRITSRSHHREHMKRHGVVELGDAKPRSLEPEKWERKVDWKQATIETMEQLTQTKDRKWLRDNLT
jgi:putative FmdB family regulatory protein